MFKVSLVSILHAAAYRQRLSPFSWSADRLVENGSIQMTIANISMDHYPYHEFGSSKKHWINYNELQSTARNDWIGKLHADWHEQFNTAKSSVPSDDLCTCRPE